MGTLFKKHDNWYLDYEAGGRRVCKPIGTSKKIAELALKDIEAKLATRQAGFPLEEEPAPKDKAIDKFLNDYLKYSRTNPREEHNEALQGSY